MAELDALERRTEKVRGLMLGLALGDAAGNESPSGGMLRSGVATQVACFTVEGLIRASMRMSHKGICHAPSVIWHAYCRWAKVQGITPRPFEEHWASGAPTWPDGWLSQVPALSQRRGNTPATVQALRVGRQGSPDHPATNSSGCQGLIRSLPIGVVADEGKQQWAAALARDTAARRDDPTGIGDPDQTLPTQPGHLAHRARGRRAAVRARPHHLGRAA